MSNQEYINELIENEIATEEEIKLVCNINGTSEETLNDILYARTGYRYWSQWTGEETEDDDLMGFVD